MKARTERSKIWRVAPFIMILMVMLVTGGIAVAGVPAGMAMPAQQGKGEQQGNPVTGANVPVLQGRLSRVSGGAGSAQVTVIDVPEHSLDMTRLGLRPIPGVAPRGPEPDGGAIGTQNAFMIVSPDVVSQSTASAIGTLLANFTPSESVQYYLNGVLAGTFTADASGRVAVAISTGAGQGYITMEGIGQTSGKRAGSVAQVLDAAPPVPGYAAGPHSVNSSAAGTFYAYGFRWLASVTNTVGLYRNGVFLSNASTNASGRFFLSITPANNGDTSAVYTAVSSTVGSMAGQSVEERADAGTPPQGDSNTARAFMDRPIFPSTGGGVIGLVGEGFQPGETVNVSGCASGSLVATANGAVGAFLNFGGGTGVGACVLTGGTSGRVGRASAQGESHVVNAPSAINQPATLASGAANFAFLFDRLLPSQSGTVYVDGVSQGPASTNAGGYGAVTVTAPATVGVHTVTFIGASGQVAIATLYVIPAGGGTPTPTATACPLNYTYSVSPGTIVPGTVDTGNHTDDGSTVVALPFNYTLYDQTYSQVSVGSNGHLTFGTVNNAFNPACMPSGTGTYAIGPYWTDQCTGACTNTTCTGCGIFTSVSGSAPNRIFNIEWRTAYYNSGGSGVPLNYEVRLYEGQTAFDVIYGTVNTFTPPALRNLSVGLQRTNTTQYTLVGCDTTGGQSPPVSSGQLFHYTLSPACPGSPTATRTRTATVTLTSTATNTAPATSTRTPTPSLTPTTNFTRTNTPTNTPTTNFTRTNTPSNTPTNIFTLTNTPTRTRTSTPGGATNTPTNTPGVATGTPTQASTPTACPMNFSDVPVGHPFYDYVLCLYCRGAISGYSDGTFRPYNNTTRGQLAKIVVLGYAIPIYMPASPTFNDVADGSTFYQYIETAYHRSLVSGYNCGGPGEPCPGLYFRPYNLVTRGQLSKIVVVAAGWPMVNPATPTFNDVAPGNPFYQHVETAYCHQIISGYVCGGPGEPCPGLFFRPYNNATRGQISKIVCLAVRNEGVCGAGQTGPASPSDKR